MIRCRRSPARELKSAAATDLARLWRDQGKHWKAQSFEERYQDLRIGSSKFVRLNQLETVIFAINGKAGRPSSKATLRTCRRSKLRKFDWPAMHPPVPRLARLSAPPY